jgi:signal transduction histidine kinase
VVAQAILDAFVISLQNGSYEASFTEWYRSKLVKETGSSENAPPLFIASLRYSMWLRLLIPLVIIGFVMLLPLFFGDASFTTYTASLVTLGVILVFRVVSFLRIFLDLRPLISVEQVRVDKLKQISKRELIRSSISSIKEHFPAFNLYSIANFQYLLSATLIAGTAMKFMSQYSLPQPYSWLVSVGFVLSVYIADSIFWALFGYKIKQANASTWIKNLGFLLLAACLLATTLHYIGVAPVFEGISLIVCVFCGNLCSGAVKRLFTSHIREWLNSDLVATWLSISESLTLLAIGALGLVIVSLDKYIPNVDFLLGLSITVSIAIIYYLGSGLHVTNNEPVKLKKLLTNKFLGITSLISALAGTALVYTSVNFVAHQQQLTELNELENIKKAISNISSSEFRQIEKNIIESNIPKIALCPNIYPSENRNNQWQCNSPGFYASGEYALVATTTDQNPINYQIKFDRTPLVKISIGFYLIAVLLVLIGVWALSKLFNSLTVRICHELSLIYKDAKKESSLGGALTSRFSIKEFKEMSERIQQTELLKDEVMKHKIVADVSSRVAHDIRSPLMVLQMLVPDLRNVPEKTRSLVSMATQRISDISTELLELEKSERSKTTSDVEKFKEKRSLLSQVIHDVVLEKRSYFRNREALEIRSNGDTSEYGVFVLADPVILKCILSNVIQNAAEAANYNGLVEVTYSFEENSAWVVVKDNGAGIAKELQSQLLKERVVSTKQAGNGIGLFNAKKSITSWGGDIKIESQNGKGTEVKIRLNRVASPDWFVSEIAITANQMVCMLEDNQSSFEQWEKRFSFFKRRNNNLSVLRFSSLDELLSWKNESDVEREKIFLINHEPSLQESKDFEYVENLSKDSSVFLLTHSMDDRKLINQCKSLGIGLVPKTFSINVPIVLK